jgi:hypothetical protein
MEAKALTKAYAEDSEDARRMYYQKVVVVEASPRSSYLTVRLCRDVVAAQSPAQITSSRVLNVL